MYALHNFVGDIGVALLIGGFLLLQTGYFRQEGVWYSVTNLLSAICLMYSLYYEPNSASFKINVFWIIISLIGICKWYRTRKSNIGS